MRNWSILLVAGLLPGCATITEGTGQDVALSTTPPGAACNVDRVGAHLGSVASTPGSLHIDKSKNDIDVLCTKDGFQPGKVAASPKFVGTTFGNVLAGGIIGVMVDASSGANYAYPREIHLDLAPVGPASAPIPTAETAQPPSKL